MVKRDASLRVITVTSVALLVGGPGSLGAGVSTRRHQFCSRNSSAVEVVAYASANAALGHKFRIEPRREVRLYGRVAHSPDWRRFTPPPGATALYQTQPRLEAAERLLLHVVDEGRPAMQLFGSFGSDDEKVGGWAKGALGARGSRTSSTPNRIPGKTLRAAPAARLNGSSGLDPGVDWTFDSNVSSCQVGALERFLRFRSPSVG